MTRHSILDYTWQIYQKNFALIILAAIPGFIGLLIPAFLMPTTYNALGGIFLRTGTISELNALDIGLMIFSMLLSYYLMSFAIVAINIVVKSQRTLKYIRNKVIESITTTAFSVFMIYIIAGLMLIVIQLLTYEYKVQSIFAPILNMIIGLIMLFLPTAIVIDEVRPYRALQRSIKMVKTRAKLVFMWLLIALFLLSIFDAIFLAIIPAPFSSWIVLMFNSLIIMPYLIVLLAQIYISKYKILVN